MTFDIYSTRSGKILQRSAIRPADPSKCGFPNNRVRFPEEEEDSDFELVDENADKPSLIQPPPKQKSSTRTNKHKVKWHNTHEASFDQVHGIEDFSDTEQGTPQDFQEDFKKRITVDELDQTSQPRRERLNRQAKHRAKGKMSTLKTHLITTTALLSLAKASGCNIIDSGENVFGFANTCSSFADPFDLNNPHHVLETEVVDVNTNQLTTSALHNLQTLQAFDLFEDAKTLTFTPCSVIDHKITHTVVKEYTSDHSSTPKIKRERQLRAKVVWQSGEVSWANAKALQLQDPQILIDYAHANNLGTHPDFTWTHNYPSTPIQSKLQAAKSHQGPNFKFGVQVPKNAAHARNLDKLNNSNLWKEATDKELKSLKDFKTFRALDKGEKAPEGYIQIPYHFVYDVKFDQRRKARLVMGGHKTPDVPDVEVYSGVVSIETIRTAFVIAARNNLQVCAADISTAFLYGKTREKVYIIAGEEFGDDAGKVMIVEGGCYGLKTSAARFHERVSEEFRAMGFRPSKADFDLWMRPQTDHYEYVATYVDDIMVFSKDCMSIIARIKKVFDLKQVGTPEYYLGGNFHTISEAPNTLEAGNEDPQHHLSEKWLKEDVNMACSAKTYIENSIK